MTFIPGVVAGQKIVVNYMSYVDDANWTSTFYTFSSGKWSMTGSPSSSYVLTADGGWNTSGFRPTKAYIQCDWPVPPEDPSPTQVVITLSTATINLGAKSFLFEPGSTTVAHELDLDWSSAGGAEGIDEISFDTAFYQFSEAPDVLAIGFN